MREKGRFRDGALFAGGRCLNSLVYQIGFYSSPVEWRSRVVVDLAYAMCSKAVFAGPQTEYA